MDTNTSSESACRHDEKARHLAQLGSDQLKLEACYGLGLSRRGCLSHGVLQRFCLKRRLQ